MIGKKKPMKKIMFGIVSVFSLIYLTIPTTAITTGNQYNRTFVPTPSADLDAFPTPEKWNWINVKPGSIIHGELNIRNIGDPGSQLNWEIKPIEGWIFEPSNGTGLTPGNITTIQVTGTAPSEKNKNFTGEVTIVNTENSSDFVIIKFYIKTPRDRENLLMVQFLERLFDKSKNSFSSSNLITVACKIFIR